MKRISTFVRMLREERRALGWKGLVRKRGWKPVVLFLVFYMVRDVVLYIVIPVGVAAGLLTR